MNSISSNKKSYYNAMLAIAIPVSIQSLFQASLSVIDQFMVGQLGETAIAAVGLGSRFPFIFLVTLNAFAAATSIFVSQYWGKKDIKNIARSFGGTFLLGLIITIFFSLVSLIFPKQVLSIFTEDSSIIKDGSIYLVIIAIGYIPMLITSIYSSVLRSTDYVKIPMYTGLFSIVLNTALNYIFIFGKLGMPAMGVYGAAYATTIARFIECAAILMIVYGKKYICAFKPKESLDLSSDFIKKILIVVSPLVLNEFMWALGESTYSAIYGRIGTLQVAAMTLTYPMQNLSIGLFSGLSSAAGIMIGNKLGTGDNDTAYKYSKHFIKLGVVGSGIIGILLILCSNLYTSIFNIDNASKNCTIKLLIVFSLILWIKVSNMIIGSGVLRSGGKTKYTLFLDMFGTWCIGVPLGFISAFVFKLPIHWVYLLISSEEFVRLLIGLKLFHSKKWVENITTTSISA